MTIDYVVPPLVRAPYVIAFDGGLSHAVTWTSVAKAIEEHPDEVHRGVSAECGALAELVTGWGAFERANVHVERHVCHACAWTVAIEGDTVPAQLAAMAPSAEDLLVLARLVHEPFMVVKVCEAIIASADVDDADLNRPEDRPDDPTWQCVDSPGAAAACAVCSARAGRYAGEWEGQFALQCTVLAPCSVLTSYAGHYGLTIGGQRSEAR